MTQPTIKEVKGFMNELGFSVPDLVLGLLMKKVGERYSCLSQYGDDTAKLLMLYAIVRLASLSGARKISSQSAPSGASRSFIYDSSGTKYLLNQIKVWDKFGCLNNLGLDGDRAGFFAVVGG